MARILLKNGKIFDGECFLSGDLLIEDEKIAAIGADAAAGAEDALVIDCAEHTVCAGLVDIHTHLSELSGPPYGFPAVLATVPFGVTAAVDAGASLKNAGGADVLPMDTAVLISLPIKDGTLDTEALDRRFAAYGRRAIGVKIYFDRTQSVVPTLAHIAEASAYAHRRGGIVMVHCTESPAAMAEIVSVLSAGDILTHTYHGAPQTVEEGDYAAYRLARERGVIIDAGMAGGVHTDFSVLRRALAKGLFPDTVSTDITCFSAYMRGGIYGLTMCMSIYRALGMPEREVLAAVTSRAAEAVLRGGEWGRLAVGGRADLAVLSFGPVHIDIEDRAKNRLVLDEGYACHLTIKNGQILYRNEI